MEETTVDLRGDIDSSAKEMLLPENGTKSKWSHFAFPATGRNLFQWIKTQRQKVRPAREFFKTDKFHIPTSVVVASKRLVTNLDYFQCNYLLVFVVLFIYCILTSPLLLLVLGSFGAALFYIKKRSTEKRLVIAGYVVDTFYQYIALSVLAFPLFYFAGAGSVIFWVIGKWV
ncbi:unnamed protein product [Soboliphyme baturini]|uniref:PRA1 family protein n=1 Tax=Soboliphyme baturini TaxID=241478 RepID=A0A183IUZ8_9BILA|nr:unnamed protein product [Soboliphyme baturini]